MNPPIFRKRTIGSGAAKASPLSRCRSGRAALTAPTGAGRRPGLIPSTAATCRWPGGRGRESAPVTRLARFPSRERDRSGAPRKVRTFAPKACRGVARNIQRRNNEPFGAPPRTSTRRSACGSSFSLAPHVGDVAPRIAKVGAPRRRSSEVRQIIPPPRRAGLGRSPPLSRCYASVPPASPRRPLNSCRNAFMPLH